MTGTLTRRLIWTAAIDSSPTTEQRRTQLRLALRRDPTAADWQACKEIRDAHAASDNIQVNRLIQQLTETTKED